jgi:hypothetical protein
LHELQSVCASFTPSLYLTIHSSFPDAVAASFFWIVGSLP